MPRIPLIEDLTTGPVPAGSKLLVEYDPASQWINASLTIAAGWLRTGGRVLYNAITQPPDNIRSQLNRLGIDVETLEKGENPRLRIVDWYTATLGQKSQEKYATTSLKVADLSIWVSKELMRGPPAPDSLTLLDNCSALARFNDEKAWVEFVLARGVPSASLRKVTAVRGVMRGVHTEWTYKQLEGAHDGIIDFKLEEASQGETRDLMRIRSMHNVGFNRDWHALKLNENLEVTIEK